MTDWASTDLLPPWDHKALMSVSHKQGIMNWKGSRKTSPHLEPQTPTGVKTCSEGGQELGPCRDRQGHAGGRTEAKACELSLKALIPPSQSRTWDTLDEDWVSVYIPKIQVLIPVGMTQEAKPTGALKSGAQFHVYVSWHLLGYPLCFLGRAEGYS